MLDALPPLFLPIFRGLLLAVTIYPGFISPVVKKVRKTRDDKRLLMKHTYWAIQHALAPTILNKGNPDRENPDKLFALAQHLAYDFVPSGWWKHTNPPPPITDKDTLMKWDKYMQELRQEYRGRGPRQ